jgi:hypothetical protein
MVTVAGSRSRCPGACPVLGPNRFDVRLLAMRPDDHDHVPAVLLGLRFDEAQFLDITGQPLKQLVAKFRP